MHDHHTVYPQSRPICWQVVTEDKYITGMVLEASVYLHNWNPILEKQNLMVRNVMWHTDLMLNGGSVNCIHY
jgi:hypothetical protein